MTWWRATSLGARGDDGWEVRRPARPAGPPHLSRDHIPHHNPAMGWAVASCAALDTGTCAVSSTYYQHKPKL
jgi:hypothetical protein